MKTKEKTIKKRSQTERAKPRSLVRMVRPRSYDTWNVDWIINGTHHGISTGKDGAATHAASVVLAGATIVTVTKSKIQVA